MWLLVFCLHFAWCTVMVRTGPDSISAVYLRPAVAHLDCPHHYSDDTQIHFVCIIRAPDDHLQVQRWCSLEAFYQTAAQLGETEILNVPQVGVSIGGYSSHLGITDLATSVFVVRDLSVYVYADVSVKSR